MNPRARRPEERKDKKRVAKSEDAMQNLLANHYSPYFVPSCLCGSFVALWKIKKDRTIVDGFL
jgi:hypothetical protein